MISDFKVSFRDAQTNMHLRYPLLSAFEEPPERYLPFRHPPSYKGMTHMPGLYWFSRTGQHVTYESRLELAILLQLDFNPTVTQVLSQPFVLHYKHDRSVRRHIPDFLVWHADGRMTVIDVKLKRALKHDKHLIAFNATQQACDLRGFQYSVQSEPALPFLDNLKWLAGYRTPPPLLDLHGPALVEAVGAAPLRLHDLVLRVGPKFEVRPVLFHLLWSGLLDANLQRPLRDNTLIDLPKGR